MALIKCPECGNEVSDKAPACIHCGYPLQEQQPENQYYRVTLPLLTEIKQKAATAARITADIQKAQLYEVTDLLLRGKQVVVQDGLSFAQAKIVEQKFLDVGIQPTITLSNKDIETITCKENAFIISCPKCGSKEYHAGARGFSLVTGFVGSGKTVLTCLKCGHRWKPGK